MPHPPANSGYDKGCHSFLNDSPSYNALTVSVNLWKSAGKTSPIFPIRNVFVCDILPGGSGADIRTLEMTKPIQYCDSHISAGLSLSDI